MLRPAAWCCLALAVALQAGCANLSGDLSGLQDRVVAQACLDMDLAYMEKLNARLTEGRITADDKERLWQAYLARIKEAVVIAKAGTQWTDNWPYTFVAPVF